MSRKALVLRLNEERLKKLTALSQAFGATHKDTAGQCIDAAYDMYTQALHEAMTNQMKEAQNAKTQQESSQDHGSDTGTSKGA